MLTLFQNSRGNNKKRRRKTVLPYSASTFVYSGDRKVALYDFLQTILFTTSVYRFDYLDDLCRNIFFRVVRNGYSKIAVLVHVNRGLYCAQRLVSPIPARMKHALSRASGRSVDVLMQTAGNGLPTEVKKLLSSGRVPLSETTAKAFICKLL